MVSCFGYLRAEQFLGIWTKYGPAGQYKPPVKSCQYFNFHQKNEEKLVKIKHVDYQATTTVKENMSTLVSDDRTILIYLMNFKRILQIDKEYELRLILLWFFYTVLYTTGLTISVNYQDLDIVRSKS